MLKTISIRGELISEFKNVSKVCEYHVLERKKGDFINCNLTKILNEYLMTNIKILIVQKHIVLFEHTGELHCKNDLGGSLWRYFVGDRCLDDILWTYSNKKLQNNKDIHIKIITNIEETKEEKK